MNILARHPAFERHSKTGKQAISAEHRSRFLERGNARIACSIDFEGAVQERSYGQRVDYFIETTQSPGRLHAVEVHAFKISDLKGKRRDTETTIQQVCPAALPKIDSWQLVLQGNAPRVDIAARFAADGGFLLAGRNLQVERLPSRRRK